jgi:hypothetical protein
MIYGLTEDGQRIRAVKTAVAVCPHCRVPLIAKCGEVKVHHWAHSEAKGCPYAYGMTQWHYNWLVAYEGLGDGWEIEYFYSPSVRFDAYHPELRQAIEFQRIIDLEYIRRKVNICRDEGIHIFWLINPEVFRNFVYTKRCEDVDRDALFSPMRRERKILLVLEEHHACTSVTFLIDFREAAKLPRYYADRYKSLSWNAHRECFKEELHPMEPDLYCISGMPLGNDKYFRKECVLELKRRTKKYNL